MGIKPLVLMVFLLLFGKLVGTLSRRRLWDSSKSSMSRISLNSTLLVLIPKKGDAKDIKDFDLLVYGVVCIKFWLRFSLKKSRGLWERWCQRLIMLLWRVDKSLM